MYFLNIVSCDDVKNPFVHLDHKVLCTYFDFFQGCRKGSRKLAKLDGSWRQHGGFAAAAAAYHNAPHDY